MKRQVFQYEAMTTYFEITIAGQTPDYARQAAAAAFRELDRLEGELSRFVESSDIARANRLARDQTIRIGEDAFACLLQSLAVAQATNHAFDAAYATQPAPDLSPGSAPFALDPASHELTSHATRLALDLGAIGKGYALDRMADLLAEWDIPSASLNAGRSTLLALDSPGDGEHWLFGMGDSAMHRTVSLVRAALSASGTAVKGPHLIDPVSGEPARGVVRAWALAPSAALSDALSTAFFVMPPEAVLRFCDEHGEIGAGLQFHDGTLHCMGRLDKTRC
jgi:thiamine biosynthesis lipoprotein